MDILKLITVCKRLYSDYGNVKVLDWGNEKVQLTLIRSDSNKVIAIALTPYVE